MNDLELRIFDLFKDYEIYLVGGYVRDKLLGKESNDLDFATSALPEQSKEILQTAGFHVHTVGWAYGTVGTGLDKYEVHITTYRRDEAYTRDNRHPVVDWGKTLTDDLKRRDFTINALAMDKNGMLIDLFNGERDLKIGVLDTPIDAEKAFSDDPLRMLRAVRFRSQLFFGYGVGVELALRSQAYRLLIVPPERILAELDKILLGDYVKAGLVDLQHTTLLNYFIPELMVLSRVAQSSKFHEKNAWLHTVDVVGNSSHDLISRYAALFHDIGKPYVKTESEDGVHFYRHEEVSAFMTKSILNRLKLPKNWIDDIVFAVANHMRPNLYDGSWSDSAVRRFMKDMGPNLDLVLNLSQADITSHRETVIKEKLELLDELRKRIVELAAYKEVKSPLSGYDVMKLFNMESGKEVGRIMALLVDAVVEGKVPLGAEPQVYVDYVKKWRYENFID